MAGGDDSPEVEPLMAHDTRNPYGMLGLPFGASRDQASRAFAKMARGLRRQADGADRLTDLTWALNQIEEAIKDPRTALHLYRIPADPGSLDPEQPGLLKPPPEFLERESPSSESDWAQLLGESGREALRAVVADVAAHSRLPNR